MKANLFHLALHFLFSMVDKTWKVHRIRGKLVIRMQFKYTTFALIFNDFVINLFSTERFGSGSIPLSPYDNHVGYGRINLLNFTLI